MTCNGPVQQKGEAVCSAQCESPQSAVRLYFGFVIENCIEQCAMDFDSSVVADESELTEFVHEETYA